VQRVASGKWFEELEPGMVIGHAITRTVTEADNTFFTCLTMNPQPLHLDEEYSSETEFGTRLVNSMFTLALVVGMTVYETTLGTTVANLGFGEIAFPKPVRHGDTIWALTEVMDARASGSRPDAGIVTFEHRGFNQHDELVARCRRTALMRRRPS
jgi:acyl dehydratase